jgi:hypothetical protein
MHAVSSNARLLKQANYSSVSMHAQLQLMIPDTFLQAKRSCAGIPGTIEAKISQLVLRLAGTLSAFISMEYRHVHRREPTCDSASRLTQPDGY